MSELRARVDSENNGTSPRPGFAVDETQAGALGPETNFYPDGAAPTESETFSDDRAVDQYEVQPDLLADTEGNSWRSEVAERLHRYRARRRPRAPRYPSLRLKFEASDRSWAPTSPAPDFTPSQPSPAVSMTSPAVGVSQGERLGSQPPNPASKPAERLTAAIDPSAKPHSHESTAKILEFPRFAPPSSLSDLAEPIMDRPRIVEVPEVVPPPPALGGILIEEVRERPAERRPGIDMPLRSVDVDQRLLAAAIDGAIVLLAATGFVAIFCRVTGVQPALPRIAGLGGGLIALLWMAYQYLLVVYSGTTPGLRAMRLRLQRFDGSDPDRRTRRWRVLGSVLSAISLGMGYAWLFLDEDRLCWHERVSKTYLAREEQQ